MSLVTESLTDESEESRRGELDEQDHDRLTSRQPVEPGWDHDVRIERLESLARRDLSGAAALLLQEITTGAWFRLECEIIAGEPSLFLVPVEGN